MLISGYCRANPRTLLRLTILRSKRRHGIGFGTRGSAMVRRTLNAGGVSIVSSAAGVCGSRGMRAGIRRLRSLVFALDGRVIGVMVAPVVTLCGERHRTKHNRHRNKPLHWSRRIHIGRSKTIPILRYASDLTSEKWGASLLLSPYVSPAVRLASGFSPPACAPKPVLKGFHVSAAALEAHSLGFEQEALLHRQLASQRDPAARAQYPLPGQAMQQLQHTRHVPCAPRIARSLRDCAIGTDAPSRYLPDGLADRAYEPGGPGQTLVFRRLG